MEFLQCWRIFGCATTYGRDGIHENNETTKTIWNDNILNPRRAVFFYPIRFSMFLRSRDIMPPIDSITLCGRTLKHSKLQFPQDSISQLFQLFRSTTFRIDNITRWISTLIFQDCGWSFGPSPKRVGLGGVFRIANQTFLTINICSQFSMVMVFLATRFESGSIPMTTTTRGFQRDMWVATDGVSRFQRIFDTRPRRQPRLPRQP